MKKIMTLVWGCLFGLLTITACTSAGEEATPTPVPSSTPTVITGNKSLPTPMPSSEVIVYHDLQVLMKEAEITSSYLTEYGSERNPPAGTNIVWIRVLLKNVGQGEQNLPAPEHFSVLNGTTEFKPTYGHRKDHADYMALPPTLVKRQEVDAWLRFDIPAALELKDLMFAFLPETSQVSFGFSSGDYPWGDHPVYLWTCEAVAGNQ
jgi:hypothetical protein